MTLDQAASHIGKWVRYRHPGGGDGPLAAARIVGVTKSRVEIKPRWHKHTELIEPEALQLWISRNAASPW